MVAKLKEILSTLEYLTRDSGSIPDMSVEMKISQKHFLYVYVTDKFHFFTTNPFWQGRLITPLFFILVIF